MPCAVGVDRYMLKTYLLTGKTDPRYLDMYKESAEGIMNHVIKRTAGWTHTTELSGRKANNVMEHLCCFFGGLFALGYSGLKDELHQPRKHLKTAEELTETCFQSYNTTATGIGPEAMVRLALICALPGTHPFPSRCGQIGF